MRTLLALSCVAVLILPVSSAFAVSSVNLSQNDVSGSALLVSQDLTQGAEKFIDRMANRAIGFLGNESLNQSQKRKEFRQLLRNNFDMKTLGRFALGRYWRTSSKADRAEYQKLFEEMIVDVYSSRFGEYGGQELEVRSSRQNNEKDATVTSFVVDANTGQEIQVDWRVRFKDGRYRVVDVVVEGVSMAVTQRSEFSSVIQRGGGEIAVLIAHLKDQ